MANGMPLKHCFVTGGLGFIGSHCCLVLLEHGCQVTIFDDLSNSSEEVFERMKILAGPKAGMMRFIKGDLKERGDLERAFQGQRYDAVIHFAGRKYVGESVTQPFLYYDNNIKGTINLIEVMSKNGCKNMVFSSSCTVYGDPQYVPLDEKHQLKAVSPYGRTKLIIEDMFRDIAAADKEWRIILLRYFNPVGAHPSGLIGEEQKGIPNNLMPYVQQVVKGQRPVLNVFGGDWNTRDGTCIRDYIHVLDLSEGHVAAVRKLWQTPDIGCVPYNLGTGVGTTVLEIVKAFEGASGLQVPYQVGPRRAGDTEAVWAATELSEKELGWRGTRTVDAMCRDLWKWVELNPQGYDTPLPQVLAACGMKL